MNNTDIGQWLANYLQILRDDIN